MIKLVVTFGDSEVIMQYFCYWSETVSCARCVGNNIQCWFVFQMINSVYKKWSTIFWGCWDHNLLCPTSQMSFSFFSCQEFSSAFHYANNAIFTPWDLGWVQFRVESNFLSVNNDSLIVFLDFKGESQMSWIICEEIFEIFRFHHWIVYSCNFNVPWVLKWSSQ